MTVRIDDYYAREADRIARGPQLYGGNAAIVGLRCFKYYHPDSGSFLTDPGGRDRWLGPKASRVYAILHRTAGSGQRVTMTQVASEAMCAPSTVSRVVTRLQSWGMLAVDVTRGRNGGMIVRLPAVVPAMRHYINAAWKRIRSWINVASRSSRREEGTSSTRSSKGATFSGTCSHTGDLDELRRLVRAGEGCSEAQARPTQADRDQLAYADFAARTIQEIRRLDAGEPDWDLWYEKVRASHGLEPYQQ